MSTLELKNKVILQINQADDSLLKEILDFIEFETDESIYETNSHEREAIEEGRKQLKNGNWIGNSELNKEIDEWLGK